MRILLAVLLATVLAHPGHSQDGRPGVFDYYVLSLSWSPNWCLREGDARRSEQCAADSGHGWILHGLWPQYDRGYPSFCQTAERPPSRGMTAAMADIMGTAGLAWHQWKKHGTCSGLSARGYYALSRDAYARINRPEILRQLKRQVELPASVIEEAFLKANPDLRADGITITCTSNQIQEARICLSKSLDPVRCGPDVIRDCRLDRAVFAPLR